MPGFGHDEELPGRCLQDRRDRVTLAAKLDIVQQPSRHERRIGNSPANIRQACKASLKRLGTDGIDLLYYAHWLDHAHRLDCGRPVEETVGCRRPRRSRHPPFRRAAVKASDRNRGGRGRIAINHWRNGFV